MIQSRSFATCNWVTIEFLLNQPSKPANHAGIPVAWLESTTMLKFQHKYKIDSIETSYLYWMDARKNEPYSTFVIKKFKSLICFFSWSSFPITYEFKFSYSNITKWDHFRFFCPHISVRSHTTIKMTWTKHCILSKMPPPWQSEVIVRYVECIFFK